jgi:glycosyltransferase involved in cell wall biosynthesis
MSVHLSVVMPVYNERYLVAQAVERVLAVNSPLIHKLDLIVVNDGSSDGTGEILRQLAARYPDRITYIEHEKNQGKGAAVRSGVAQARGTVTVIHDADLEYNPQDLPKLMVPFVCDGADAVYGSRFLVSEYGRVLYFRHFIGNRLLTTLCNLVTDLNLTDMETCYKAVRTRLLQSIPIRSNDFRIEPELTIKLAKRGARMFEVPISYSGRTYEEGKKISFRDGILAFGTMLHWWLVDDMYQPDEHGIGIALNISGVPNYNRWLADVIRPYVRARVLEVSSGIGNLARALLPRDHYTLSDWNPHYLDYLRNFAEGKPYIDVRQVHPELRGDFTPLEGQYDTALCLNVLERMSDELQVLRNLRLALVPSGRAILLVPQNPNLMGSLDEVLGNKRRYTRERLAEIISEAGFEAEEMFDFNRITTIAWWLNGRVLRRRSFGKPQLKAFNMLAWLLRRVDKVLTIPGVFLIAIARRRE